MLVRRLSALIVISACTASCSSPATGNPASSPRPQRIQDVKTTAYTHTEKDHLVHGVKTAAGSKLKFGSVRSAAADWSVYPVGTVFQIEGEPYTYEVDDYGSALVGTETIDLYKPNKATMNKWGVRRVNINVIKWGSFTKSLAIMKPRGKRNSHVREMVEKIERGTVPANS
jgi:3D (Asp-Asp-Asp) domain-containing protein